VSSKTYLSVLAIAFLPPPCSIAQGIGVSQVLTSGASAYRSKGTSAAVNAWLENSFLGRDSDLVSRTVSSLKDVEAAFGAFVGLDVVATSRIGSRVVRNYVVLLYERGPLFAYFDTYRASEKTTVTGFLFNTKPDAIFPSRLL